MGGTRRQDRSRRFDSSVLMLINTAESPSTVRRRIWLMRYCQMPVVPEQPKARGFIEHGRVLLLVPMVPVSSPQLPRTVPNAQATIVERDVLRQYFVSPSSHCPIDHRHRRRIVGDAGESLRRRTDPFAVLVRSDCRSDLAAVTIFHLPVDDFSNSRRGCRLFFLSRRHHRLSATADSR